MLASIYHTYMDPMGYVGSLTAHCPDRPSFSYSMDTQFRTGGDLLAR